MNRSLGEVEAQIRNAVRGAGYHWGHADEAAAAVRWLESASLPGAEVLAARLQRTDGDQQTPVGVTDLTKQARINKPLCPIVTGASLLDAAPTLDDHILLPELEDPLLLVPAVKDLAAQRHTVTTMTWSVDTQACAFVADPEGSCQIAICRHVLTAHQAKNIDIIISDTLHTGDTRRLQSRHRTTISDAIWTELELFAHRTRAPATDQSRRLGAGDSIDY